MTASARLAAGFQDVPVEVGVRFRGTTADPVELSALAVEHGDVMLQPVERRHHSFFGNSDPTTLPHPLR